VRNRVRRSNDKCVGFLVGAVFLVAVLLVGLGVFSFMNTQMARFQDTRESMSRYDTLQKRENIVVIGNPFNEDDTLNVTVVNAGNVETVLVRLSVLNQTTRKPVPAEAYDEINVTIRPQHTATGVSDSFGWSFPGGHAQTANYTIQLVSSRGSVFDWDFPRPGEAPKHDTRHIVVGPFVFDLTKESFRYTSEAQPTAIPAWEMDDSEDEITFYVDVTNFSDKTVEVNGFSYLLVIIQEQPVSSFNEDEVYFYIVDPTSTPDNIEPYVPDNPQRIGPGESATLKFAARSALEENFNSDNVLRGLNDPGEENLPITFLVTFWRDVGGGTFSGHTIPFAVIHLNPP
jgi:hypothetical protein